MRGTFVGLEQGVGKLNFARSLSATWQVALHMNTSGRYRRRVQFRVLGPLEVDAGDGPIPLGGPKQRAVLATLLIRANQVVPAETLIDEVWGDEPPEKARNTLQTYVSNLRRSLGEDRLQGRPPGYVLLLDPSELDATRFDSLVRDAKKAMALDPNVAMATLDDALALWRGPALADLADRPSVLAEAARLDELRLDAQEERAEGLLAGGHDARAIGELETLIARHPLRESLWGLLMLGLYRDGRQADALNAYQRAREILADQLGIDPSPELARLHERILQQDVGLELTGEPLRGYRLLEKLGDGPGASVFRAIQPHVGRDVAVKVFQGAVASDPAFVQRFELDAKAAAALEHPHIAPTYDAWREPGRAYVVGRYLRGGSLRALADRGDALESDRAVRVVEQVASALAFAHRQGVAHGNVCPANVFFDGEGNAYLGDFLVRGAKEPAAMVADVQGLAAVARAVLGAELSEALAALIARAEGGSDVPDASAFVEAARTTLDPVQVEVEARSDARNPYKGLRAFEEADTSDFFGRTEFVRGLVARLHEAGEGSRFLAVVGPSGGGKSSVVRAGLVPAIRRGELGGPEDRFVAEMLPGAHPIEELEGALLRIAVRPASRLRDLLEAGSRGLLAAVDRILPGDAEIVIVVDQFEEVFTLTSNERDRELFLESLRVACVDPASRVRVVVTLRADFYDRPLVYPRFGELLAARTEAVPPLTPDELEQAIRRPAERVGVHPDRGLEAAMIADVAHEPGALPLLQYALTELFERRDGDRMTLDTYSALGGVAGALSTRAERLLREADPAWQRAVRQVLLRLVTLGEGALDTRRRVTRSELDALEVEPETVDGVLDAFGRHRLLTFDREPSTREPTVEIAHEALLGAWARLGTWIDEAREDLRQDRRLARAAAEWRGSDRDPSFLLGGTRLEQIEVWASSTDLAIGRAEREYIKASLDRRDAERAVEAARRGREQRLERRSRTRLRALVAVFAAAALVAGVLTIVATDQRTRAADAARVARARELAAAAVANVDVDPERSVLLAIEAVEETRSVDGSVLPEAEGALHAAVVASRTTMTIPDAAGPVAWGARGLVTTAGADSGRAVQLRNERSGEMVATVGAAEGTVTGVVADPTGSLVAVTRDDGTLTLFDGAGEGVQIAGTGIATSPSISADGSSVAAGWPRERVVRIVDVATGRDVRTLRFEQTLAPANGTALDPHGKWVAVATEHRGVIVIDVATRDVVVPRLESFGGGGGPSWSPNGRYIVTNGIAGPELWDAHTGKHLLSLPGHPYTDVAAWSPDSTRFVTAGVDASGAKVWRLGGDGDAELLESLNAQETNNGIVGIAFSPDGRQVVAGAEGLDTVKIWDLSETGDAEWMNLPTLSGFGDVAFMPDGHGLVAAGADGRLRIWDVASGASGEPIGPRVEEHSFALSPDGTRLSIPEPATIWDTETGDLTIRTSRRAELDGQAWSPDGELLALNPVNGGPTTIVDRAGDVVAELPGQDGYATWMARFSPDGRLIATIGGVGTPDSLITIWDWRRERVLRTMRTDLAVGLTFDPSGSRVVTMFGPGVIWDVHTGERLGTLDGYPEFLGEVEFSPNGRRIAAGAANATINLFDATSGTLLLSLRPDEQLSIARLAFSADGSMLATTGPGKPVRVWAIAIDDLLRIARENVTRQLTDEECRRFLHLDRCP
jgi:DNA-binding SARP family transcriptional activator/WD40 repeat protein